MSCKHDNGLEWKRMAGYTATLVACEWAGAAFELLKHLARSSEARNCKNKVRCRVTKQGTKNIRCSFINLSNHLLFKTNLVSPAQNIAKWENGKKQYHHFHINQGCIQGRTVTDSLAGAVRQFLLAFQKYDRPNWQGVESCVRD